MGCYSSPTIANLFGGRMAYFLRILLEFSCYLSNRYANFRLENALVSRAIRLKKRVHASQRVMIYGSSFNPTTSGHVDFIRLLLQKHASVCLLPAGQSPLKSVQDYASVADRLNILNRVLQSEFTYLDRERIRVETIELTCRTPSWTVLTLTACILQHQAQESYILACGYDHLLQMQRWYRWSDLANLCDMHFYPRVGIDILTPQAIDNCVALGRTGMQFTIVFLELLQQQAFQELWHTYLSEKGLTALSQQLTLHYDPSAKIRASSATDIRTVYQNGDFNQTEVPDGICPEAHRYILLNSCYRNKEDIATK